MRFIPHHEKEWGLGSDRVWVVVVGKLGIGIISTEDLKVGFNFLVDLFSFSVGLGVIGGGEERL